MSLEKLIATNKDKSRRFEIVAKSEAEADVFVYDTISAVWGIDPAAFVKALAEVKATTIHLRINSPGGDVFAARAMGTALKQHPARIIAHIDGLAASAASFLMLVADRIEISDGAFVMIHAPWAGMQGNAEALRQEADLLDKIAASMAADYAKRTGASLETVAKWMDGETWFSAQEALDAGLVDEIVESVTAKAEWDLSAYQHAPATLVAAMAKAPTTGVQGDQSAPDESNKEIHMDNSAVTTGQTVPPNQDAVNAAVQAETHRCSEINRIGIAAKMPADAIQAAITGKVTVEAYKDQVLNAMVAASQTNDTRVGSVAATVTRDETDTRRFLMVAAVLNRIAPATNTVDEKNGFRHMSCLRMAEEALAQRGVSVRGLTPGELAIKAMQQTSDFANVLENSARKLLLARYAIANPTYKMWTKASTTPDFKTMSRSRLSEAPTFIKVPEGAQITIGTMSDVKETYALATYGRGVSFTRQMLINDDLGAFNDLITRFGDQAAILENKTVYSILTTNANMSDSAALFVDATHGNLKTGTIGNTGLDTCFTAMGIQKGLDGTSVLGLTPKFIIVPKAKEATARAAMTAVGPSVKASDQNWFAGRLEVVADGVLDATDTAAWYAAADPNLYPGIEYAHLEGANGPQIIRKEDEGGILGVNLYAFLDFGAKAVDWRPLYKSSGS